MKKAYVTVFFSIVITLCLSLLVGLIYGVRENALRMRAREVMDITLLSAFAEYDVELWRQYGLIFVDAGYSHGASSMIVSEEHAKTCMNRNFDEIEWLYGNSKDLLKLSCVDVETKEVRFATDHGGRALINQAVSYMKYHYKLAYVEELYKAAKDYEKCKYSEADIEKYHEEMLQDMPDTENVILTELKDLAKDVVADDKKVGVLSILRRVVPKTEDVSVRQIMKEGLPSGRELNQGNAPEFEDKITLTDGILFKEYLLEKCGNYISEKKNSVLKYEVEYLLIGKQSDAENLEGVAKRLLLLREAANLSALYADEAKQKTVLTIASILAFFAGGEEMTPVIQAIINALWAYFESMSDVKALFAGKKVPLLKTEEDWVSGFELLDFEGQESKENDGLDYKGYLRILLYPCSIDKLTAGFMDICEMDIRSVLGNTFRLDYCFDYWGIWAYVISGYGYDYEITGNRDMEDY